MKHFWSKSQVQRATVPDQEPVKSYSLLCCVNTQLLLQVVRKLLNTQGGRMLEHTQPWGGVGVGNVQLSFTYSEWSFFFVWKIHAHLKSWHCISIYSSHNIKNLHSTNPLRHFGLCKTTSSVSCNHAGCCNWRWLQENLGCNPIFTSLRHSFEETCIGPCFYRSTSVCG